MNRNLVQKTITDKNGVVSNRWVKPDAGTASSGNVPAPQTESKADRERNKLQMKLRSLFGHCSPDDFNMDTVIGSMYGYGTETLKLILKDIDSDPESRLELAAQWVEQYGDHETYIRELYTYCGAFDPVTDYSFVEDAISYMRTYEGVPELEDYSAADEPLQQQLYDVLAVTEALLAQKYEEDPRGVDPKLPESMYRLVVDRPQDLDRIVDIIRTTPGVCDGEQIAMMLDSSTPSLAEGIL